MKELKTVCKNCSAATLKVYSSNIRRLYKIYSGSPIKTLAELPKESKWLMSEKMGKKYKSFKNNIRRHLSSAGFIATKLYGLKEENQWNKRMIVDAKEYEVNRARNVKSEYEEKNIPKGGLADIKKALKTYKIQIKNVFTRPPSLSNLYKYQLFLALKLMSTNTPFRNDLPGINVEKEKGNYLAKNKGGYKIVMTKFKNSAKVGPKEVPLNRANSMEMKRFLKYRDELVDHEFLFSLKSGKPMTKSAFGQALIKLTSNLLNKKVGSRLIRVMFASENTEVLSKADDVSNKMLHAKDSRQTRQYVRK
jgi:hypothetical protein